MRGLARGRSPEKYFSDQWGYPVLDLPWWIATAEGTSPDLGFHADLVYSTVNGYYFVRLVDDAMDEPNGSRTDLLPATAFFHSRFQAVYHSYFPSGHPFWRRFERCWFGSAQAASADAHLATLDMDDFVRLAAAKTGAAKIPVAAICYRRKWAKRIPTWSNLCDLLSRYIQMADDVLDWPSDCLRRQGRTFFLSEADRRRNPGESIAEWVAREGLSWGLDWCLRWLDQTQNVAAAIACPPLERTLRERRRVLLRSVVVQRARVKALAPVIGLLSTQAGGQTLPHARSLLLPQT